MAQVKQLYEELHLPEKFNDFKRCTRDRAMRQIDELLHTDETLQIACINFFSEAFEYP